eukprot:3314596-Rhodomonas_salina.5
MCGTDLAYAAMFWSSICCGAMCGADLACAATRCAVLRSAMLLPDGPFSLVLRIALRTSEPTLVRFRCAMSGSVICILGDARN